MTPAPPPGEGSLDSMLVLLQSDLSRQGVPTGAKGLCASCHKPIAGQVGPGGGVESGRGRGWGDGKGLTPLGAEWRGDGAWDGSQGDSLGGVAWEEGMGFTGKGAWLRGWGSWVEGAGPRVGEWEVLAVRGWSQGLEGGYGWVSGRRRRGMF